MNLHPRVGKKLLIIMRYSLMLLIIFLTGIQMLNASNVKGQQLEKRISLSLEGSTVEKALNEIGHQAGIKFVYANNLFSKTNRKISNKWKDEKTSAILDEVLSSMDIVYNEMSGNYVVLKKARPAKAGKQAPDVMVGDETLRVVDISDTVIIVKGRLVSETADPVNGVSVIVKGTKKGTTTNSNGEFELAGVDNSSTLVISGVNIDTREIKLNGRGQLTVVVQTAVKPLEETVVKGYYTTTKKTNTGSVGTVTAQTIANQPVTDPIAAMQGRVSGLMITSSNGMPGSAYQVRIRGENSMTNGNNPLYVIDGVPYIFPGVGYLVSPTLNQFSGANGDQSPLASINPSDIERIDVLKDADATAIYGSRGANGVILISTKKGKTGTSKVNVNVYTGISKIAHKLDMLNTQQYLELRNEGFANDGATKTLANAYDFLVFDQNRYTDWQDLLLGNTAKLTDAQISFSGGNDQTTFMVSATGHKETTVLPGDFSYKRGSSLLTVNHMSKDRKFGMDASVKFATDHNNIVPTDVSQYFGLAPNYNPYNADGSLYYYGTVTNPIGFLNRTYDTWTNNLISSLNLRYTILPGLSVKANVGFTLTNMKQEQTLPAKGFTTISPVPASQAQYAGTEAKSYIAEPQIEYTTQAGIGKLSVMAGASWQHINQQGDYFFGTGFSSDALLKNKAFASTLTLRNSSYSNYNYSAVYGRIGYDINTRYLLNLTFRRDGSSRFGSGDQFGNFAAAGAAWIFSDENFIRNSLSFLSYGKLRGSYGVTGNDQIGDYQYLDRWSSASFPYAGVTGIAPESAYNPDFGWESTKKLELALELGFLNDRIFLTSGYYRHRSNNALINLTLSPQSGFSGYFSNSPAQVQNSGLEFDLNTTNIKGKNFTWATSFNVTIPSNKLLRYDNLETSSDAVAYKIGESTRIVKGFKFTGVDPATGIAQFLDVNKDGIINEANDWVILGSTLPTLYGGFSNQLKYKNFSLDIFFQFVKQESPTVDWGPLAGAYGGLANKTTVVLDRWRKPGDITNVPRATVTSTNPANVAFRSYYRTSSAVWGDASYMRLKNLSIKYNLSSLTRKFKLGDCSIYLQGQNLFTITNYNGLDPEINGFDRKFVFPINPFGSIKTPAMPVLRSYTIGLNLSL